MKVFVVFFTIAACTSAGSEKREKRGFLSGLHSVDSISYDGSYSGGLGGLGDYLLGLSALSAPALDNTASSLIHSAPAANVVSVRKVVNTARVFDVPQIVSVRQVVSVPQVVSVNKVVAPSYYGGLDSNYGYGAGYDALYGAGYSSNYGYGAGYPKG